MDEDGIEEKAEEGGIQKLKMRTQKGLSKKKKLKERNNEFADEGKKQKKEKVEALADIETPKKRSEKERGWS